ncbi:hypothetical protein KTS45_09290 [Halomicroarcula limicola]|uniref:Small CPxCG-related zinc finger protein n=1 Tax=Haloarcula limicola TaxID=1429915 RepID=A0A8J7Y4N0_9EURY|nr:hypothetical protein [Halomicroarcula limicola]MBV0924395.1 hypothetical protein [Halomicroarcula limicola]
MVRCENCGAEAETTDELDHDDVKQIELDEGGNGPPRVRYGANIRDLWLCKQCGKVLGVS